MASTGEIRDLFEKNALRCVRDMVLAGSVCEPDFEVFLLALKNETEVCLPLRINWGGTWTDTPPYCLENGGAVVNAAVLINASKPVKVVIKRLSSPKVILEYFDSGLRCEYHHAEDLCLRDDPLDAFVLLKSALAACGLLDFEGFSASEDLFQKLPGGISISAGVVGIPKGSGLGTSSILLAACIKGLFEFFGQPLSFASLCRRVLLAEQLMGTGGGWQDQAGGLVPGIKLAVSAPNFRQEVVCHRLTPPPAFLAQLTESFCLVYSGQRRVGRTILREIMRGYIQSDPLYLRTLKDIRTLADETKTAVSSGDFFGLSTVSTDKPL
jgi:fucokinase